MIPLAEVPNPDPATRIITSAVILSCTAAAVYVGWRPLKEYLRSREQQYDRVLRRSLLMDVEPRMAMYVSGAFMLVLAVVGYVALGSAYGFILGGAAGLLVPQFMLRFFRRRRLEKLERQIVAGIQTLASAVRAGLNLVQAMQLVAREGPSPLRQEFSHLVREYEYGLGLEDAMNNAAARIGSGDFRLLFTALLTHRQRGGDLGITLDRIAESIREIQRLEGRVKSLTAQGRATARWLGAMPAVVLIIYYFIEPASVTKLLTDDIGKLILLGVLVLNIVGFLWIKKIVSIDI